MRSILDKSMLNVYNVTSIRYNNMAYIKGPGDSTSDGRSKVWWCKWVSTTPSSSISWIKSLSVQGAASEHCLEVSLCISKTTLHWSVVHRHGMTNWKGSPAKMSFQKKCNKIKWLLKLIGMPAFEVHVIDVGTCMSSLRIRLQWQPIFQLDSPNCRFCSQSCESTRCSLSWYLV